MKTRLNAILKRCGMLLQQHYFNIDYTPTEEMSAFRVAYKQFYCLLELQEVVDLDYRLDQLIISQRQDGSNKSKLKKLSRMHIIEQSPELHQPALEIATKLMRRYENDTYSIHIDLDTLEPEDVIEEALR